MRKSIFISYSHRDEKWLDKLYTMLTPLVSKELLNIWVDKQITPGSRWREEITKALSSAKLALLLSISAFLFF